MPVSDIQRNYIPSPTSVCLRSVGRSLEIISAVVRRILDGFCAIIWSLQFWPASCSRIEPGQGTGTLSMNNLIQGTWRVTERDHPWLEDRNGGAKINISMLEEW